MKLMQVVPNPYRTLDADGNPIAVFPCHMQHAPGEFVGATKSLNVLTPATFVQIKGRSGVRTEVAQYDRSKAVFTFSEEPFDVPADGAVGAYYKKGVKQGALIPANKATAIACNVPFVDPKEALEKEKQNAAREHERQCGELPAWASEKTTAPVAAP